MEPVFELLKSNSNASEIKSFYDRLPGDLKDSNVSVALVLVAIRSAIPE